MNNDSHRRFWEKAAQRVCRRINSGFCLQLFLPVLLGLTLLQGCLLLFLRKIDASQTLLWISYAAAALLALAVSAWWSRKRFFSTDDGLVHLEARLFLHSRLSAARQGQGAWPAPRILPKSLRWTWQRLVWPSAAAAAFLFLAGWVPLKESPAAPAQPPEEPSAWKEVESWAEILKERDLVEEESLDKWKEQVQTLRDQETEDWYSHSSLEAGDNLRENAAESIRGLQNALENASHPLSTASESLDDMPTGLQPILQEHWMDALSELASGNLTLNSETLAQLGEVDFNNLQALSQEQIEKLQKMLREGRLAASECVGGGLCEGEGEGSPCPTCPGGVCQGNRGIGRGPGAANLTFQEFPNLLDSQRTEAVSNQDLSRAALGQKIGTTQTAPEVDEEVPQGPVAAGDASLAGNGGEAVFHSRLTPAEQRRLQAYFD